jgi:hypothetical protein
MAAVVSILLCIHILLHILCWIINNGDKRQQTTTNNDNDHDCDVEEVFDQVSCPGFGTYKPCNEDDSNKDEDEDMKAKKRPPRQWQAKKWAARCPQTIQWVLAAIGQFKSLKSHFSCFKFRELEKWVVDSS